MAKNQKAPNLAKQNLKAGFAAPHAKLMAIVFVVVVILMATLASIMMRKDVRKAGEAEASDFQVSAREPRGGIDDGASVKAVESRSDGLADEAQSRGQSFAGPFVFQTDAVQKLNVRDAIDETSGKEIIRFTREQVLKDLRTRMTEMDRVEQATAAVNRDATRNSNTNVATANSSGSGSGSSSGGAYASAASSAGQGGQIPYGGLSPQEFKQIADQLTTIGSNSMSYGSSPNGLLARSIQGNQGNQGNSRTANTTGSSISGNQQQSASFANPATVLRESAGGGAQSSGSRSSNPNDPTNAITVAQAGDICAAVPENAINTDFMVPAFFELQDCRELTGVRAKGVIQKGAGDFVITFSSFYPKKTHKYKFSSTVEGVSINVSKDGIPGVADNVDNHWATRFISAGLLAMAKTEKQFLNARGTTTIWGTGSSSTTVDGLTAADKNAMRGAGLMEGALDVLTRDTNYGVQRAATMTMNRDTVIGIQFQSNVQIIPD